MITSEKLIPRWLQLIAILFFILPFGAYKALPEYYAWIGTILGLFMLGIVIPIAITIHITNRKSILIAPTSALGKSSNKNTVLAMDALIRLFFLILSLALFLGMGLNLTRDIFFLLNSGSVELEVQIVDQHGTLVGTAVAYKKLTVRDLENDSLQELTSIFVFENYKTGDKYLFSVLPYSGKVLKVQNL